MPPPSLPTARSLPHVYARPPPPSPTAAFPQHARSSRSPADSEGASWDAWRHQDRHFFIITSAGKPVYSMVGDEDALAGEWWYCVDVQLSNGLWRGK